MTEFYSDGDRLLAEAQALEDNAREIRGSFAGYEWGRKTYYRGAEGASLVAERQRVLLAKARRAYQDAVDLIGRCESSTEEHRRALETERFTIEIEPGCDRLSCLMLESSCLMDVERALVTARGALNDVRCILQFAGEVPPLC